MATAISTPQADDGDDEEASSGDLSSLVSPTSMWMENSGSKSNTSTTTACALGHKVSIHTGGMDLKTLLLSQGGSDYNNNSTDYIFTDDESGSSPAASRIGEDEVDLLCPISTGSILGVEQPFQDEDRQQPEFVKLEKHQQEIVAKNDVVFSSSEEWSVHNQQRGRELAKHVIEKMRSKQTNLKSPEGAYVDKNQVEPARLNLRCSIDLANKAAEAAEYEKADKAMSRRGFLSRCIHRLRRQRRNFLDKVFLSKHGAAESPTAAPSTVSADFGARTPSQCSHFSADSFDSYTLNEQQENDGFEDTQKEIIDFTPGDTSFETDGGSIYIEDDITHKKLIDNHFFDYFDQDCAEYEGFDFTKDSSTTNSANKHSGGDDFADDDSKQIHHTSQVVDMILRQFVDGNAKTTQTSAAQIKKPIKSVLMERRQVVNDNASRGQEQQKSKAENINTCNKLKATSRVRSLADAADEIRKLGKEGEMYLAQLERQQRTHPSTKTSETQEEQLNPKHCDGRKSPSKRFIMRNKEGRGATISPGKQRRMFLGSHGHNSRKAPPSH